MRVGVIAALLPQPIRLQRLRAAVRDLHTVTACADWMALTRLCESRPVHLAVLDLYSGNPNMPPSLERVRVLKRRFPRVGLIAYVSSATARARDMFDAGRFGLDALVVADVDDAPPALLAHVEKAEARSVASVVQPAVAELKGLVRDAVLASVTRAHEGLTADTLARLLVVPRRSLIRQLAEAGFPAPQQLLIWGRLILAAHLLEDRAAQRQRCCANAGFPLWKRVSQRVSAVPGCDSRCDPRARGGGVRDRNAHGSGSHGQSRA